MERQGAPDQIRLGIALPSVNTVVEPWMPTILPQGVSLHIARMLLPDRITQQNLVQMDRDDGERSVLQLMSCRPHAIVYACVASSVVQGDAYDRHLIAHMQNISGRPCESSAGASVAALKAVKAKRIAVVSPYDQEVDSAEHAFLRAYGFDITKTEHFGVKNSFELADVPLQQMIEAGKRIAAGADAIFLSCMNVHSHLAVDELEQTTKLPVITATTATAWALMRMAGLTSILSGLGQLGEQEHPHLDIVSHKNNAAL
jgi:maleate isomerase